LEVVLLICPPVVVIVALITVVPSGAGIVVFVQHEIGSEENRDCDEPVVIMPVMAVSRRVAVVIRLIVICERIIAIPYYGAIFLRRIVAAVVQILVAFVVLARVIVDEVHIVIVLSTKHAVITVTRAIVVERIVLPGDDIVIRRIDMSVRVAADMVIPSVIVGQIGLSVPLGDVQISIPMRSDGWLGSCLAHQSVGLEILDRSRRDRGCYWGAGGLRRGARIAHAFMSAASAR
jgi:hypothetical protein